MAGFKKLKKILQPKREESKEIKVEAE